MSAHSHDDIAPPRAIALAGGVILLSLLLVSAVRFGAVEPSPSATTLRAAQGVLPAAERLLRFDDRPDGTVLVTDARTAAAVGTIGREDGGFVRGVMRGLARERRQHGIDAAPPFRLTQWRSGHLSLHDPSTRRTIELDGFGHTNRASFERLLGDRR